MLRTSHKFFIPSLFILCLLACDKDDLVDDLDELGIHFEVSHVTIYGHSDGQIIAHVYGGLKPYLLNWSTGEQDSIVDNLYAGDYYITVTDAANQTITDSVAVDQPDSLQLIIITADVSDLVHPNGSIHMDVTGGVPPYNILWSTGDTTAALDSLLPGTYWVKVEDINHALAIDTILIDVGENIVMDRDGNLYPIIKIGDQTWMKENLRVTHSPEGDPIDSYCYNDNEGNASIYGRLYTWDVAMNGSVVESAQGICPDGFHIPSDNEWIELEMYLGMAEEVARMENIWRGTDEGAKLRVGGSSGYDVLYSGRRSSSGTYSLLDQYEYVWTSTEYGDYAWRRCLRVDANNIGRWNTFPKSYGFSVRCLKD